MSVADEILDLPVAELAPLLDTTKLTSVELTNGYLARIERIAPELNCFITVTAEQARADAARADAARASGRRGPLLGIPYAVKDAIDTAGIATTWGTRALLGRVPSRDATVIARLRDAGAVLLGKTSLTELCAAFNDVPEENHNGPCRNPWDRRRWTGGSSSGSAAAIAAGLCGFALGTETQGSIDHPASWCGVVGVRPTYDLVPREGVMPLSWSLDKVGMLCRDVRDAWLVLPVLAAQPGLDAVRPVRIGIIDELGEPATDPANALLWGEAKAELERAGFTLVPVVLPELPRHAAIETIIVTDILVAFEDFIRTRKVDQLYARRPWREIEAELRGDLTAVDYVRAMRVRTLVQRAYRDLFGKVDAIASFGTVLLPRIIGQPAVTLTKPDGRKLLRDDGNLAGLPALTLPIGFTSAGLPRSMHLVAAPFEERVLLSIAEQYQSRTEHHRRRPHA